MLIRVRASIRRRALFSDGDRVAVAVSGGSDSVALAWALHDLSIDATWRVAGIIHVNHGLRGAESDEDEAFCRDLAARLGRSIEVRRVDVRARARARRRSIETTARELRYAAFDEAAATLDATVVATGHTLDDQAETVLLRALAGTGTRGLSGVRPARGCYRRPLIDCRRRDLEAWLTSRGEPFRIDPTNADLSIPRNRVRHELLPVIERIAPGGIRALARLADLSADDEAAIEGRALELLPSVAGFAAGGVEVRTDALGHLPPAIARRLLRAAVSRVAPEARLGAGHLETVLRLAASEKTVGRLDLPGVAVERRGGVLVIRIRPAADAASAPPAPAGFEVPLPVPGVAAVPGTGVSMRATCADRAPADLLAPAARRAVLRAGSISLPLVVRSRRPGDRFRPLGAPGRRKVHDLLVDRKVPREARDRVPIVTDAAGRVVWVAGVAIAHECRVTAPEEGVVILELWDSE